MSDLRAAPASSERPPRDDDPLSAHAIPLGHWAGIPVGAHWSVLATVALFADLLAASALPAAHRGASTTAYWVAGVLTALAFLVTLFAHELAHALVARHFGIRVRRITLWMLGGFTDLSTLPPTPKADGYVAVVGPATSVVVGLLCGAAAWAVGGGLTGAALAWLAGANVLIGVFNLLPGAPLDGGRVVRAIVWSRSSDRARGIEAAGQAGRILGGVLLFLGLLEFLYGGLGGLWLALLGWFIVSGAGAEVFAGQAERLHDVPAASVMTPVMMTANGWWTVAQFLDEIEPRHVRHAIPVVDFGGEVRGALMIGDLVRVPPDKRNVVQLRQISARRPRPAVVTCETAVPDLLPELGRHGGIAFVVDDHRAPLGLITQAEIERAIHLRELGWPSHRP